MIDSFDVIFFTAIFIMPGFLINNIIDATNPPKNRTETILSLRYLGYSIINCAFLSWAYKIILPLKDTHPVRFWLLFLLITFIGAMIIGFLLAILKQNNVVKKIWDILHIRTIHPTPTAWDYIFSQQAASYVIVTLQDGTEIRGLYSTKSFCSSENDCNDIFIEKTYKIGDNGEWIESPDSNGIYIACGNIKHIEFKEGTENE